MDKFQLTRGTIITLEDEEEITGCRQASSSIILGNFMDSQYKSVEVGDAFRLLEKAMLLELVYPTTSVTAPIMPQIRRSPKLSIQVL
ncbi:hypothetical protein [Bacteroides intestinalis]|uniref:hypothetical protein n=1 Tax=Bacteroides intestinalis TaxID=329854 RepID=UPI001E57D8FC|nr:hypothetical protein [Bacteroides intestinalis]